MSYAEADGFRRAMTHERTAQEMEKMRGSFISRAVGDGIGKNIAEKVFEQLAAFAAYGFCKGHACAYAITAYQTLWLKSHYPAEFLAAVLSNQPMGYYPSRVLVAEAQRFGIEVLAPDVNKSSEHYKVEEGAIRVSLKQLKGMSEKALESILSARAERNFTSLRDFVLRTDVSQPILENLVKVGAFDSLGNLNTLLLQLPKLSELKRKVLRGTVPLFEDAALKGDTSLDFSNDDKRSRLFRERELLSLDLSAHPLDFYDSHNGITRMKDLPSLPAGRMVKLMGSVIRYETPPTKTGKRVIYVIMEDGTGIADVTVFSDVQEKCGRVLFREAWLTVRGKIQRRGQKSTSIIADELYPLSRTERSVVQEDDKAGHAQSQTRDYVQSRYRSHK